MNVVIYEFGAAPFEIAGFGVERDNSALITAGCAVKDAVFDEWGFSVAPVLLFAAEVAEVFFQITLPFRSVARRAPLPLMA